MRDAAPLYEVDGTRKASLGDRNGLLEGVSLDVTETLRGLPAATVHSSLVVPSSSNHGAHRIASLSMNSEIGRWGLMLPTFVEKL